MGRNEANRAYCIRLPIACVNRRLPRPYVVPLSDTTCLRETAPAKAVVRILLEENTRRCSMIEALVFVAIGVLWWVLAWVLAGKHEEKGREHH